MYQEDLDDTVFILSLSIPGRGRGAGIDHRINVIEEGFTLEQWLALSVKSRLCFLNALAFQRLESMLETLPQQTKKVSFDKNGKLVEEN